MLKKHPARQYRDVLPFCKCVKHLKNGEKQKSHFLLFELKKSKDGLFQHLTSSFISSPANATTGSDRASEQSLDLAGVVDINVIRSRRQGELPAWSGSHRRQQLETLPRRQPDLADGHCVPRRGASLTPGSADRLY